jgi:hypothetical protein
MAVEDHHAEFRALETEYGGASVRADVRKTVGDVGTAFVMQASGTGTQLDYTKNGLLYKFLYFLLYLSIRYARIHVAVVVIARNQSFFLIPHHMTVPCQAFEGRV